MTTGRLMTDTPAQGTVPSSAPTGIDGIVSALRTARHGWRVRQDAGRDVERFPSRSGVEDVVALVAAALYPRRLGHFRGAAQEEDRFVAAKLLAALTALEREIGAELAYWQKDVDAAFPPEQAALVARLQSGGADRRRVGAAHRRSA